jgi:hypothetical protein
MGDFRIHNERNQAVELHLPARVLALAPYGAADLTGDELAAPQVAVLIRQSFLSVFEADSARESIVEAAPPDPRSPAPKRKAHTPAKSSARRRG